MWCLSLKYLIVPSSPFFLWWCKRIKSTRRRIICFWTMVDHGWLKPQTVKSLIRGNDCTTCCSFCLCPVLKEDMMAWEALWQLCEKCQGIPGLSPASANLWPTPAIVSPDFLFERKTIPNYLNHFSQVFLWLATEYFPFPHWFRPSHFHILTFFSKCKYIGKSGHQSQWRATSWKF